MEKKARKARREEDDGVDGDGHISKRLSAPEIRGEKNILTLSSWLYRTF